MNFVYSRLLPIIFGIVCCSCKKEGVVSEETVGSTAPQKEIQGIVKVHGVTIQIVDLAVKERTVNDVAAQKNISEVEAKLSLQTDRLTSIIWTLVLEQVRKENEIEASNEEIRDYKKIFKSSKGAMSSEERERWNTYIDKASAKAVVGWKTDKFLYEKYGGAVIFQQANPMQPVGAYRSLLKDLAQKGKIDFYDNEFGEEFWERLTGEIMFEVDADYSKPWWKLSQQ